MNIRNANINPNRSEQLRGGYVNNAGKPENQASSVAKTGQAGSASGDRVEISDAGRAAAGSTEVRELAFARKALDSVEPLSAERAADIRERLQSGFYQQPDVVKEMAAAVAIDLTGNRQV